MLRVLLLAEAATSFSGGAVKEAFGGGRFLVIHQQSIFRGRGVIQTQFQRSFTATTTAETQDKDALSPPPQKEERDMAKTHRELNFKILDRKTKLKELAKVILDTPAEDFSAINASTATFVLGRRISRDPSRNSVTWEVEKAVEKISGLVEKHLAEIDPRGISDVLFGVAVGALHDLNTNGGGKHIQFNAIFPKLASQQDLSKFTPSQLSSIAWSLATIGKEQELVGKVAAHVANEASKMSGQDLGKLIFACARAQVKPAESMLSQVAKTVSENISQIDDIHLAPLITNLAKLGHKDAALFKAVSTHIQSSPDVLSNFPLVKIAQLVEGFTLAGVSDDELMSKILDTVRPRVRHVPEDARERLKVIKGFQEVLDEDAKRVKAAAEEKDRLYQERKVHFEAKKQQVQKIIESKLAQKKLEEKQSTTKQNKARKTG